MSEVSEGHLDNQHLYNDKELIDDPDLGWYDYGFRSYDPQIGRFPQLDPLTDDYPYLTPYQYASDDPITNIDIDGLEGGSAIGAKAGEYIQKGAALENLVVTGVRHTAQTTSLLAASGGILSTIGKVAARAAPQLGKLAVDQAGRMIERKIIERGILATTGTAAMTVVAVLLPLQGGNAPPEHTLPGVHFGGDYCVPNTIPHEVLTNDPSTLSDEYLNGVEERLLQGGTVATPSDYSYANEVVARKLIRGIKSAFDKIDKLLEQSENIHQHHVLPQKYRIWFKNRGIDNIDHYTISISRDTHLKGVHGKGLGNLPGKWNDAWDDFIKSQPTATPSEIFHFAEGLLKQYGLEHLRYKPW